MLKTILKHKRWIWAAGVILLACSGILAYIYIPGRGNLPDLAEPNYWPTEGWQAVIPEQEGIDSEMLAEGVRDIQEKQIPIDSLMIIRNGYSVLDVYYAPYDGSFPHDIASVTKSIMTTLIGISVDQGKIQLDQKVISFFPDRSIANLDERKKSMTVLDLVSMRNGMESSCLDGDEATLDRMRATPDWVQAALDRKMVYKPGTHFCYDSPGMHLLSAILQEATGMTALEYAQQNLFEPLGISDIVWLSDSQGYTRGWGDLHMKPGDAAKLGYLWLYKGVWDGQQIVSADWVEDSIQAHSRMVGSEYGYGYGWWVTPVDFYALGREGQYIRVIPSLNTIIVLTGGGSEFNQVMTFLVKTLLGSGSELQPNPEGQAALADAIAAVSTGSTDFPSIPLPTTAGMISNQTYICAPNPTNVAWVRVNFNQPGEAGFTKLQGGEETFWPIGFNGIYKTASDGQAQTGYWEDEKTFVLNLFDIGQVTRRLHFEDKIVEIYIPEIDLTLECRAQ